MPSEAGQYDEALLAAAPATTKAQLQEGYSTDLLNPPQRDSAPPISSTQVDAEHGLAHKEYNGVGNKPTPFFRTGKGKITILILVIVVLAAIIGGAVGGTQNHKNNSDVEKAGLGESSTSSSASVMSQGAGETGGGLGDSSPPSSNTSNPSQHTVSATTSFSVPFFTSIVQQVSVAPDTSPGISVVASALASIFPTEPPR
ncbi:hypothetical protein C0989_001991 [Termitomyces sp. Mn162]|nr:hypothetical protein C0989_001991 [Termitomyces sp. Mn162]